MTKSVAPATRMRIRVNPLFDLEIDPSENEFDYVNPVALKNQLIVLANEQLALASVRGSAERQLTRLRLESKKIERIIDDIEQILLRDEPLSPSEAKSLKTIAAAVARRAKEAGKAQELWGHTQDLRALEDTIEKQQGLATRARLYTDIAQAVSENIKTALSFVKHEREEAGKHGIFGA